MHEAHVAVLAAEVHHKPQTIQDVCDVGLTAKSSRDGDSQVEVSCPDRGNEALAAEIGLVEQYSPAADDDQSVSGGSMTQ